MAGLSKARNRGAPIGVFQTSYQVGRHPFQHVAICIDWSDYRLSGFEDQEGHFYLTQGADRRILALWTKRLPIRIGGLLPISAVS